MSHPITWTFTWEHVCLEWCAQLTHSFHIESISKLSLKRSQRNIKHVLHTTAIACRILGQTTSSSHPVTENKTAPYGPGRLAYGLVREALNQINTSSWTFFAGLQNDEIPKILDICEDSTRGSHYSWRNQTDKWGPPSKVSQLLYCCNSVLLQQTWCCATLHVLYVHPRCEKSCNSCNLVFK